MKKIFMLITLFGLLGAAQAQNRFFTKTGKISFDATTPKSPENIDGVNKNATCVLDSKTGDIQFSVLMKGFEFDRALMMEHFNENYAESDKFPKTIYKGIILNNAAVNYAKDGSYPAKVKGKLTMHGETKELETEGTLTIKNGKVTVSAIFPALLSDYKVGIPQLVADKVAKTAKITVDCTLEPLTK
ncbi:MAG TPA: YceI family protein [Sediminibacterium sp.]|nr:YceI family protein [Sediminibacterium sp.]